MGSYSSKTLPDQIAKPVTPRYGLTYQYSDNDVVYATAAKGYRAGGGNAATSVGMCSATPPRPPLDSPPYRHLSVLTSYGAMKSARKTSCFQEACDPRQSFLWSDTRAYVRADYRWLGTANALNPQDNAFDPEVGPYQNRAYGVLDVRFGVLRLGWDVSAYVLNATNADPLVGFSHAATGDPLFTAAAIRPLTAGFTAYYRF